MQLKLIKGLSDKRIADLNKIGVYTAEDLLRVFPRGYLDMRKAVSLSEAQNNQFVLTKGTVVSVPDYMPRKAKFTYFKIFCEQDGEPFTVIWFNQPYVKEKIKVGETYLFYGRLRNRYAYSITNPSFEVLDGATKLKGIVPVYSVKGCVTQKVMRSAVSSAIEKIKFNSLIDDRIIKKYALTDLGAAYRAVHMPENYEDVLIGSDRIACEEYFLMISAFKIIKTDKTSPRTYRYSVRSSDIAEFTKRFGFEFTQGQKKAVNEIFSDMKGATVMNRLLQGDVGSGKTAVSLCALYIALKSGYQAVMLAPTEVLAKQNYEIVKKYLPEFERGFLSGSLSAKEKNSVKNAVAAGEIKILVGTHAVLENDVKFKELSLCVCDEQQRFGVNQRNRLVEKSDCPDVLIMSATPIPRTLSLVLYGDLDISTILDKPVSRQEILTGIVPKTRYDEMLAFIQKQVDDGRQAYFVCPKIDGDEEGSVISVTEIYDELKQKLPKLKTELLHGRMKDEEKTAIMTRFKSGEIDAIVSTTVIEVGIDVPNATVMAIYGADRFGLSQLHQLRGRVGRSSLKSYCFLMSDNDNERTIARLATIKNNSDGFKIAEADYDERGGGDFLGTRQSGKLSTDLGALRYSASSIFLAKKIADDVIDGGLFNESLRQMALSKYDKLKDVTLN